MYALIERKLENNMNKSELIMLLKILIFSIWGISLLFK